MDINEFSRLYDLEEHYLANERAANQPDPDLWRWSPMHLGIFDRMLRLAAGLWHRDGTDSHLPLFFEAGCGIGTKLALARGYGMAELGWELFDEYIAVARELGVNVEKHDLRAEQPPWSTFDIVYINRPFKDDEYERNWEESVQRAMRPGAVLIAGNCGSKPYDWPCFFREPWRGVWRKPAEIATGERALSADQRAYGPRAQP